MDVIKRAPIRERQIPLKQRVEEGTQFDCTPRLGRSSPDPKRELSSHRYALVKQPRLAEPGAPLHHDHATGTGPDLVQPPTYERKLLLTSGIRIMRDEAMVEFKDYRAPNVGVVTQMSGR